MGYEALSAGDNPPGEINVVIEIVAGSSAVKYEVDEETHCLMVDRFMNVPMHYPANYGFVPKTRYDDGDPVDALVLTPEPIVPGAVVKCRPVAVLDTEDESGLDAKILTVPTDKISTDYYKDLRDLHDVPERLQNKIAHFFEHYKDHEKGKWTRIHDWRDAAAARAEIEKSIAAYKNG
jgi:inorganic pyrophosphatase